ncbi:MAG: hypothetical protein LQ338_007448 [Usnochroma carphineum]|nr:MAG: hypothetical protein LQ338_007448 [Usnochroma carphineum]
MSSTATKTRRLSTSSPPPTPDRDLEGQINIFELIDLIPSTPPYKPQPPSPLLTAASDSPPSFPFARTPSSTSSSFSDLGSTVKPLPKPQAMIPASLPPQLKPQTIPPPAKRAPQRDAQEYTEHDLRNRFLDFADFYPDDENIKDDMPPGYPYKDWRGIGLLALEYLKGMQGLLLGFMEKDCRWGGARHTI